MIPDTISSSIRAVIFDVGSVLVRDEDRAPRARLAKKFGLSYEGLIQAVFGHSLDRDAVTGKITTAAFYQAVGQSLGIASEDVDDFYREFYSGNRMDYALIDFIRGLRTGYKTAILSNALDDLRGLLTTEWRVADAFDEIIISAEEGCIKPDPEIYHITLKKLGLPASATVFIDDLEKNIKTARQIGMHGIVFQSPEQAQSDLKELLAKYNS